MKRNIITTIAISTLVGLCLISCNKVLEKPNLGVYTGDLVWTSETQTSAYLNSIYAAQLPGWSYNGSASDEATDGSQGMADYLKGIATIDSYDAYSYAGIDAINLFLSKIDGAPYPADDIKHLKGQALFWRAWAYFKMVKAYGGVPLILQVQDAQHPQSLFVKRNKSSECFIQMEKDLTDAANLLPDSWSGNDWGRIDKGAALAFLGKVGMWWASPLFNPGNDQARWQAAYTATKSAKDFLASQGKGLYPDYGGIWYNKANSEVIIVNQFYAPDHYKSDAPIRPEGITEGDFGHDQAVLALVNTYPMKDGSAFDPAKPKAYDTLFKYRDNRFYATLAYNGSAYNTPDFKPGEKIWTGYDVNGISLEKTFIPGSAVANRSGFWQIKGMDHTVDANHVAMAAVDWLEMRYAEVLMNYGECANEAGHTGEALQVIYDIRKRAGILPGSISTYGVTASGTAAIREAYVKERFVEFAFENKRWDDLRRWRRFDILNTQQTRGAIHMMMKPGFSNPVITDDINDPAVWSKFTPQIVNNIEDPSAIFNLSDKQYFYGLPKRHLDANPNLQQNNNWGGAFDPLQ